VSEHHRPGLPPNPNGFHESVAVTVELTAIAEPKSSGNAIQWSRKVATVRVAVGFPRGAEPLSADANFTNIFINGLRGGAASAAKIR
jgi:hypothetical protein